MLRRLHRYGNVDGPRVAACYELAVTGLSGDRRRAMYTEDFRARLARLPRLYPMAAAAELCDSENVIDRCLHTDQMTYLPGDLLVKVDRMTMAHGLEGRSPLLDHMIVEFAASLPTHLKLHGTCRKYLLKKLLERKFGFSSELVHREKQGFAVPVRQWLCGDLRELLEDSIRASTLVTRGIFRREAVLGILDEHLSGKANRQTELWSFLNLELWNQQFGAG
jgi:asparagine synthase (glutamine-hydrolysing)